MSGVRLLSDVQLTRYRFCAYLLCLLLTLSACQSTRLTPKQELIDDQQWIVGGNRPYQAQWPELKFWKYAAKVGIHTPRLREAASLTWAFANESNVVRLFGPLGAGAVKLEFDKYGVQLSDSKGVVHQGDNAEQLLTNLVGWPIPIDSLSFWLAAQPAPNAVYRYRLDEQGRLSGLEQFGWIITFADYREYAGHLLPRKVGAVKKNDGEQAQVSVKLVAKAWIFKSDDYNIDD